MWIDLFLLAMALLPWILQGSNRGRAVAMERGMERTDPLRADRHELGRFVPRIR